jgi:hypothetical protein
MGEGAGIGRPNRVQVATGGGALEIPLDSRDKLCDRLGGLDALKGIHAAFEAAGVTRPVELSRGEAAVLIRAIDEWGRVAGALRLPAGIWDLRNALAADQNDN